MTVNGNAAADADKEEEKPKTPERVPILTEEAVAGSDLGKIGAWVHTKDDDEASPHVDVEPFRHAVIPGFLSPDAFKDLSDFFPEKPHENLADNGGVWWYYKNPIEVKYACDKFDFFHPKIQSIFHSMSHPTVVAKLGKMFDVPDLQYDPHFAGAGLHMHPRSGLLGMHIDYDQHPFSADRFRRVIVILYANEEWKDEWNGDTQLYTSREIADPKVTGNYTTIGDKCITRSYPQANKALAFVTNENTWHGVPEKIACPEGTYRRSLAFYYIAPTPPREKPVDGWRNRAIFVRRPTDVDDERMDKLYEIRATRRIMPEDMEKIYPDWDADK